MTSGYRGTNGHAVHRVMTEDAAVSTLVAAWADLRKSHNSLSTAHRLFRQNISYTLKNYYYYNTLLMASF